MGRRTKSRSLSLWSNGVRVGTWTLPARGAMELRYADDWMASDYGRPLSLSLPFGAPGVPLTGERVGNFFDNLLPDSDAIRRRLASRFQTASTDAFDLLTAIGRDCVGAVQLMPEDRAPAGHDRVEGVPVSDEDIERHLLSTVGAPSRFGPSSGDPADDFRISLAGAQEKDAFLRWNGRWMRPLGATPTTHIFKLPMGLVGGRNADFSTSVDNEFLCMRLLQAFGLPVAHVDIRRFGQQRVLVVERFDRAVHPQGGWLMRLPQEDFCQALGIHPDRKYEQRGGPGLDDLSDLLKGSIHSELDLSIVLGAQIAFWLLRAPDGHAKNFSLRLLPAGRFHLTPLYDVMSAWPALGKGADQWAEQDLGLAMAMVGKNRHYRFREVQRRHFTSTARKLGLGLDAERLVEHFIEHTDAALASVAEQLPADFSGRVWETISRGLPRARDALASMPKG